MTELKRQTAEIYDRAAEAMARKFDGIGARVKDEKRKGPGTFFMKRDT